MKAWLLALAALSLGCAAPDGGPGLLQLTELSVREVGRGDTLEIVGAGFPEGRVARLTFRGDVFRPGRSPQHGVEASIAARTATPHVLEANVSEELVTAFCGRDDGAHATFRGDITAAFAPRKSGAPPVAGSLQGIVLDVEPSRETDEDRALAMAEGERFARFLGVTLSADGGGPLRVQKLEAEGRGAEVGLTAGDVIEELSGVRIGNVSDFVPPPRARSARIGLQRGGIGEAALVAVDVVEFKPGTLSDLTPAMALVGSAILALLLALSPLGRFSTWLALTVAKRSRGRELGEPRRWLVATRGLSGALPGGAAAYFGAALGSSLLALSALGAPLVARELDLPILLLAASSALTVAGFLSQLSARRALDAKAGAKRALWVLLAQLPIASALLVSVISVGSLRADDFSSAQLGMPWHFLAFSSPAHFMALLLGIFALVPEATLPSRASSGLIPRAVKRWPALPAVEWAHLVVMAGLLCIMLLGGFAVPWLSELDRVSSASRMALGAGLLVLKTFCVVLVVAALRWSLGRVSVEQCRAALLRVGLPAALALPIAAELWLLGAQGLVLSAYRGVIALALFVALTLGCGLVVRRLGQIVRLQRGDPNVNPWL
ncbi:MAG TPA: NADH-quinone oxidoreductase subunit H [Polyangiaceae bacterium]|nr:NADH-quinone oxidoreductase subunit H [Polyangiaceae bacterium]